MTDKGQHLDLSSGDEFSSAQQAGSSAAAGQFLGVHFQCCDVYVRVYPNAERTAYQGNCPRCARPVKFLIGEEGTCARFFSAR